MLHRILVGVVGRMRVAARTHLVPELGMFAREDALPRRISVVIREAALRGLDVEGSLSGIGSRIVGRATAGFVDQVRDYLDLTRAERSAAIGVRGLGLAGEAEAGIVKGWVDANVDLITSIRDDLLGQVAEVVDGATREGLRVEALTERVMERFDVGESRAALIARDQTLKLNGDATRATQTGAGIREYVWDTSRDERVRERHAELHGTRQSWDDPPEVSDDGRREHPGGDYQCRCVAIPVLDGLFPALESE